MRSSLDNLESEGVRGDQRGYLNRAREGIVAAAVDPARARRRGPGRGEHQASGAREFRSCASSCDAAVAGYRDAFPDARFVLETPADACLFCAVRPSSSLRCWTSSSRMPSISRPAGGTITLKLVRAGSNYELSVENDGPSIPDAMLGSLFESLFEHRQGSDDKPHFGLGLYIVRLIAEFHDGRALAANRSDGGGADSP